MKPRNPIRIRVETWLAQIAFVTIAHLPRCAVVEISRVLGRLAWCLTPTFRKVGMANLGIAFGDTKTAREKQAILLHSFQSIALVLLDTFWFSRRSAERIARYVHFDPCFDSLFTTGRRVCVTAHYGNWEVMGMSVTQRGFPLHSVAKPLKNPRVDALFIEARRQTGQQIVRREGAVRALFRILQQDGKIAVVLDQNTRIRHGGRFYPFFGLPVLVSSAPAALAIKTDSDIFIGMLTPQPDGSYRGDFGLSIPVAPYREMGEGKGTDALTLRITKELEDFLRQKPDHWMWYYKRWKFMPADANPAEYPFYSEKVG